MPIQLPSNAHGAVRAGQVIGSLGRAVEELVRNSASAAARRIEVRVGNNRNDGSSYLIVTDDGHGIDPDALRNFIGTEHCSSRRSATSDGAALLAERGESLKSIAALSTTMEVSTSTVVTDNVGPSANFYDGHNDKKRRTSQLVSCEKVVREGEAVSFRSSESRADTTNTNGSTGTTVTVHGLFHRYAVRRRHREATKSSSSLSSTDRADLNVVRSCLRSMALAYPLVHFRVINGAGAVDFEARPQAPTTLSTPRFDPSMPLSASFSSRRDSSRGSMSSDAGAMVSAISHRLKQLSGDSNRTTAPVVFSEELSSSSFPYRRSKSSWGVLGTLSFVVSKDQVEAFDTSREDEVATVMQGQSKRMSRSRLHQHIFINKRPAKHSSALAEVVQSELSAFLPYDNSESPYFILHVTCSARDVDLIIEEERSTLSAPQRERMERLLRGAVSASMKVQGYSRRRSAPLQYDALSSRRGSARSNRRAMKVAPPPIGTLANSKFVSSAVVGLNFNSLPSSPYFLSRSSCTSGSRSSSSTSTSSCDTSSNNRDIRDDDELISSSKVEKTCPSASSPFSAAFFADQPLALFGDLTEEKVSSEIGSTNDSQMDRDENEPNKVDNDNGRTIVQTTTMDWTRTRLRALEGEINCLAVNSSNTANGRRASAPISLSKEMLSNCHVISQIDDKFIIIKAGGLLCVVDQHAASERVGLERLETRLFKEMSLQPSENDAGAFSSGDGGDQLLRSVPLLPAQSITLSPNQLSIVLQHAALLKRWKFSFKLPSKDNNALLLDGVPGLFDGTNDKIATRQDFCHFLQTLECRTSDAALVTPAFVKRVLASRACRSAIMFGDQLSLSECEDLIASLAQTSMCFICAHGRPSVAPLLDMRSIE